MVPTGKIGNITWHRIVEAEGPEFDINFLLPTPQPKPLMPTEIGWNRGF